MKGKIAILSAIVFTFVIHGVALADGGGGIPTIPPPPQNPTGVYVKGYFTIAYEKANLPNYAHHNVHAVLRWSKVDKGMVKGIEKGKRRNIDLQKFRKVERVESPSTLAKEVHLFSGYVPEPKSKNLCKYDDDYLRAKFFNLPAAWNVPAAFGIPQAKTYVTQLKITDTDFCGDTSKQEPDAMIRGEVEILLYTEPQ